MKISTRYIYSAMQILILSLSLVSDWYRSLSLCLTILLLVMIVDKMGKGIVLRESTAMLYVITCLFLPVIGYMYYTSDNQLARLWVRYMSVPEDIYFSFALPAISCFCLAITWPLGLSESDDEGKPLDKTIVRIKEALVVKKNVGLILMVAGLVVGSLVNTLPGGLQFFATLFFFGSFAGLLYVYYLPDYKRKKLILVAFTICIVLNALSTGMFSIVAYMGVTIYSFFLIKSRPSFLRKVLILLLATFFIIVLQSTKMAYRKQVWNSNYTGNQSALFGRLLIENIQKGDELIGKTAFFNVYTRLNQGFNVALVMRRIPYHQPYDGGNNLLKSLGAAIVPRFLWPDKPEAGGRFNMKYYAGFTLKGWSTNVGPLGEAYGSFGVIGGIIYMLLLGAFIRWSYKKIFVIGRRIPLLICWIPVLFFQITYSGEGDTLQILNSLFKATIFIWILYKIVPIVLGVVTKKAQGRYSRRVPMLSSPAK